MPVLRKTPSRYVTVANQTLTEISERIDRGNYTDFKPSEAYTRLVAAYREIMFLRGRLNESNAKVEKLSQKELL